MTDISPPSEKKIVVGFWRRFIADALDDLLLSAVGFAVAYPLRYQLSALGFSAIWIGVVASFAYFGILHTSIGNGQTVGKRLLGIQVIALDGSHLGPGKSLLRHFAVSFVFYNQLYGSFLQWIPVKAGMTAGAIAGSCYLLFVIWMAFACFLMIPMHPLKRGAHDLLAGSLVVYKGTYDAAALEKLKNPARARTALLSLTTVSALITALAGYAIYRGGGKHDQI